MKKKRWLRKWNEKPKGQSQKTGSFILRPWVPVKELSKLAWLDFRIVMYWWHLCSSYFTLLKMNFFCDGHMPVLHIYCFIYIPFSLSFIIYYQNRFVKGATQIPFPLIFWPTNSIRFKMDVLKYPTMIKNISIALKQLFQNHKNIPLRILASSQLILFQFWQLLFFISWSSFLMHIEPLLLYFWFDYFNQ